jgi:hypothetical protein
MSLYVSILFSNFCSFAWPSSSRAHQGEGWCLLKQTLHRSLIDQIEHLTPVGGHGIGTVEFGCVGNQVRVLRLRLGVIVGLVYRIYRIGVCIHHGSGLRGRPRSESARWSRPYRSRNQSQSFALLELASKQHCQSEDDH